MYEIFKISKEQYEATIHELELLREEYDALKKSYDELVTLIGIASKIAKE